MNASHWKPVAGMLAFCLFLTAIAFLMYRLPADLNTWLWFGIALSLCLVMKRKRPWWQLAPFPLAFFVPVLVPYDSHRIIDVRGGRTGTALFPGVLRFQRNGPNTRLIEHHLGPVKPEWRQIGPQINPNPLLSSKIWEPGEFHRALCNSGGSIIFRSALEEVVDRLPHDEARRQVLQCVTDPENYLRFAQELLLERWKHHRYQPEDWWQRKQWHFFIQPNAQKALETDVERWLD